MYNNDCNMNDIYLDVSAVEDSTDFEDALDDAADAADVTAQDGDLNGIFGEIVTVDVALSDGFSPSDDFRTPIADSYFAIYCFNNVKNV